MNHDNANSDSMPDKEQLIAFTVPYAISSEENINQVLTP